MEIIWSDSRLNNISLTDSGKAADHNLCPNGGKLSKYDERNVWLPSLYVHGDPKEVCKIM
jgi:hypothetical protein